MSVGYSVVIPTRDGGSRVAEVVAALDRQVGAPAFEVVVADDGSTDGTPERLRLLATDVRLRVEVGPPVGPASARNRGVAAAVGRRVAFLGDDTLPEPDWLLELDRAWRARGAGDEVATLGYTRWHPRVGGSRFLNFLNEEGLQFGFSLIDDPENVPFNFFYTSNVAADRDLLRSEPFDDAFPYPAWEDIEAAYRLVRRGMRIVFAPRARVLHDHPTDYRRFAARQERAGFCAVVFWQRHPDLGPFLGLGESGPPPLPGALVAGLRDGLVRALQFLPVTPRSLWNRALRDHYLRGLHRAWRQRMSKSGGAE